MRADGDVKPRLFAILHQILGQNDAPAALSVGDWSDDGAVSK